MSQPDRESILARFTQWLDQALAREEAPPGIPAELLEPSAAEPEHDLFVVQAALTALTQEVKLQGRSFKQLTETMAPVAELAPALGLAVEQSRREARREVLDLLLDLRDRLKRGEEAAGQAAAALAEPPRWWRRRQAPGAGAVAAALREGYGLTLARLEEALQVFGVSEIDCEGLPFDAARMHAVEVEEAAGVAEGTVVSVLRRGYEWNGAVYRPAGVRVTRRRGSHKGQPNG